jgi:peroxiredoxin
MMRASLTILSLILPLYTGLAETLPDNPDEAWEIVQKAIAVNVPPLQLQGRLPTKAEMQAHRNAKAEAALHCADIAGDFARKFPDHPRAVESRKICHTGLSAAVRDGALKRLPDLERVEREILSKSGLSPDQRFQLRAASVERAAALAQSQGEDMLAAYEAGVRQLQGEFPGRPEIAQMLYAIAVRSSGEKARALADEIRRTTNSPELKTDANKLIARAKRVGGPLRLRFTSVEGQKVDTASFLGKVVLVNFWATWSAPSISQIPRLTRLHEDFEDRGLVLLGISTDHDRNALNAFLNHKPLPWPQCFDNDPNSASLSQTFGVEAIPAIWLIDRQGRLRFTNAALHLEDSVQTLLSEEAGKP